MSYAQKIFACISIFVFIPVLVSAQQPAIVDESQRQIEQEMKLREKIEEEKQAPEVIEAEAPAKKAPLARGEKAYIKEIKVINVTLLSEETVQGIVRPFRNKTIGLEEMQKIADLITDAYRTAGFVTSRGYLPPQKIQEGVLLIRGVEGVTGNMDIKGNRFFRTEMIRQAILLEKGEPFDYYELKKGMQRINEHPDRKAKAVLVPGKEPGTTDIILEVADNLPVHARLEYDNYASRYVGKNRYTAVVSHNNLSGHDDILSLQYQLSDDADYQYIWGRYLYPLTPKMKLGLYASKSDLDLGKEYAAVDAEGESEIFGIFATHELVREEELDITLNTEFEYMNSKNYQLGSQQSRDKLRIVKLGLDIDLVDHFFGGARTIIAPGIDFGIPDILGGSDEKDTNSSRTGAGGKFVRPALNLLRLQKLPWESALLWKNQAQVSGYVLPASQQLQLGGVSNVRGYPSGETYGDMGYATTFEWLIPPYLLPKDIKVPFSKAKFYDTLKFALFYDWGWAKLRQPQAGERREDTLRSFGCGLRLNLPEDFSIRADLAWPLDRTPSDGDHFHPWFSVSKQF